MQHTGTTAPPQDPDRKAAVPYPHRIRFDEDHRRGIVLGHHPTPTTLTKWVQAVTPRGAADRVGQITHLLVAAAHQHTRSGDPGGTVRVVIDVNPFLIGVAVTDSGPRPDAGLDPRLTVNLGKVLLRGLALNWSWEWEGTPGASPLTIRAVVENP